MPKKILLIEDDEFFRGLIGEVLLAAGFSFSVALDGKKGVEKAKEIKPDLILLDLLLPLMNGFQVLAQVKSDPETASIPVIILSNISSKEDIDKALALGAINYLIKSQFDLDSILNIVKSALNKK